MHLEWCRQQVSKRFTTKLRGCLGRVAHHQREMRALNRVPRWRSSEALSATMITHEGDPRHVDFLLRDYGLEHGKSQGKTVFETRPRSGQSTRLQELACQLPRQKLQSRCMRNLFIAMDRRPCRKAKKAARQWRSRRLTRTCNTERVRQAEVAVVPPATAHCLPRSSGSATRTGQLAL